MPRRPLLRYPDRWRLFGRRRREWQLPPERLDQPAEAHAGAQELLRINRLAVDARLVVQMRAGGAPGRADLAAHLADMDGLADLDVDLREVAVARGKAVAVVDLDHVAVAALAPGDRHAPGRGRVHRIADVAAHVEAGVHRRAMQERVHAHAEGRTHVDL